VFRLYDTATERVQTLVASPSGEVGLYVCGPTVYGPPHVGHGRLALVFDVLRRYLEHRGMQVHHVSNVTDVDDKILDRAKAEGRPWQAIAEESEAQWWQAMESLDVLRPHDDPHATAYVPQMIELVGELLACGAAYRAPDGVYLSVAKVDGYGLLAHQDLAALRAGERVSAEAGKRSPLDFALWKAAKRGEPSWDAPFGAGRPGWHTECVVMSLSLLGEGFSLHGGGYDLVFPHHENERAQAVALGRPFARHWVHNGLVEVSGQKMSKSLGNFLTLAELVERVDARAYRLLVLRAKYRSPLEATAELLEEASRAVRRVDELAGRLAGLARPEPPSSKDRVEASEGRDARAAADLLEARFVAAMDDDLDTASATAVLFDGLRDANKLLDARDALGGRALAETVLSCFAVTGLLASDPFGATPDEAVLELARTRDAARAAGDYAAADAARSEIEALGWRVEDTAWGTRLRR
jgi:cysteinyl-tRNA synthetase